MSELVALRGKGFGVNVRTASVMALFLALVLATAVAGAAPSEAAIASARAAFQEGSELLAKGQWDAAAERFRFALEVKPTPGLYFHLGTALSRGNHLLEARAAFEEAAKFVGESAQADVSAALPAAVAELERDTPKLRISGLPDGGRIELDGAVVSGVEFRRNPGATRLVVEAPGYERFSLEISLERGETRVEHLALERSPAEPVESPKAASNAARDVVIGAGLGAFLTGGVVGVIGLVGVGKAEGRIEAANAAIDGAGAGSSPCRGASGTLADSCAELTHALADRENAESLMTIGFVAAGVGAVTALGSYLLWGDATESESLRVGAAVSDRSAFFELHGSF